MKSFLLILFVLTCSISLAQTEYKLGEKDLTQDKEQAIVFTSYEKAILPKLKDSVDLMYLMPPAGNQGTKGSCWAWATTYVLRSVMDNAKTYLTNDVLNTATVYSPEYVYQIYKGDIEDCDWGAYSYEMLDRILKDGVVKYSDFSYDEKACNKQPKDELKKTAKNFSKTGYLVEKINDLYSIQKVLSENQPLVISIKVDDFFCKKGNITKLSPFWNEFHTRKGSHAMVVVGYNNRLNALKVLNSWGESFGDKGYVWISYSIINSAMNYCCYPKKIANENLSIKTEFEEESSEKRTTVSDSKSTWPTIDTKRLSTWFKEGYYRVFDNFRVGLAALDKRKKFAIVDIRDDEGELKTSFYIDVNTTKEFYMGGKKYQFSFDNIGSAGNNFFTKAVYFTINRVALQ